MSPAARPLALVGLRCSGKSSVGRALAARLGRPFVDLDAEIERQHAAAGGERVEVGQVLQRIGEPAFRDLEARALELALEREDAPVVATGGGVVEREDNRSHLARRARCIYLRCDPAVLGERLRADPALRPPLVSGDAASELGALAERRDPWYAEVAELTVDTGALDVGRAVERIVAHLG